MEKQRNKENEHVDRETKETHVCIDRYEAYNTSFGFLGLLDLN